MNSLAYRRAFSIVELIIVIVVIGILATVTLVSYPLLQNTARDSKVREGATKIAHATQEWSARTGETPESAESGYGSVGAVIVDSSGNARCDNGGGTGWIASGRDSSHSCTLEDILVRSDYLPQGYIESLPVNPKTKTSKDIYYISYCYNDPRHYALLYTLRNPSAEDDDEYASVISTCGVGGGVNATFKSQYQLGGALLVRVAD